MSPARVVFVVSKFPCYDEAFLLREIHTVARQVETWIFSLRHSAEEIVHEEARALLPRTLSVPYLLSTRLLFAHLRILFRRPGRYLAALWHLLSGNRKSPEFLAKNLAFFPKAVWLADWVLREGVTHLHGAWATYPASVALLASEITGVPFSFSGHAHDIYLDTTHLSEKLRRAAFVTTCTAKNRDYLRRLMPEAADDHVTVVHHGLPRASFPAPIRMEQPLALLSVGTLNAHKGFVHLIDALALLQAEGLDFHATIVGGGPLEDELRGRLLRAGLDSRVTLTGARTQAEVLGHYARASMFVLMAQPEWHWGIPNVIVEALAARCAVITTRFGSVEELVEDGRTGLLVPPRDAPALAAAIRRLAGDPALRARLAEAGNAVVSREYDLERSSAFYVERFRRRSA